ncbi:MAG TPA: SH3 domain-containing protein [Actinophytocola sp.]|jgi:hypothetical protein|uniref:SH3 domain-containing protein n=1 Tax=Actinophytocola sp. TaxID=1872138 RepID=UPI002E0BFAD5|nr:SH3 domain-containing protein [Actinophytocola sp.]
MALLAPKRTLVIGGVLAAVLVLYVLGSDKQQNNNSSPTGNTTQCRVSVTADVLNVRAAPDVTAQIVGKFTKGQETDADKVVQAGFRKIGENRWIATDFAQPLSGRDC